MEIIIGVVVGLVIGLAIFFVFFALTRSKSNNQNESLILKQDLLTISKDLTSLKDSLNQTVNDRLDKNNELVRTSINESTKLISEVSNRLTKLDETNKRVVDVADELKMLQNVLQNPKQRGGLGEYYLDSVLGNVLAPNLYQLQYPFEDGEIVDAVIKLDQGRLLAIDSKFSLENYNRLVEETDKSKREVLAKSFKADLKKRIDETAKYIRPAENTLDYAFMFIPSEAIYYDLLVNKVGATTTSARDLIEYAFRDKHVIIVSPTTLLAYLQTVLQGLRSLQIEEQAKDIQKRVAELSKHLNAHQGLMNKLGNSLGTSVNHFNNAHKELKKFDKDVVKIADTDETVEPLLIEKPDLDS